MDMTVKVKLVPANMSGFKAEINKAGQVMIGGAPKGGAIGGGALGGIGDMFGKMLGPLVAIAAVVQSSKALQKTISTIMKSVFMVIRPIGDILAMFLRPIADVMRVVGKVVMALWRPMQKSINQQLRAGGQALRAGDTTGALSAYGNAFGMLFKPLTDLISAPIVQGVKELALGTVDIIGGLATQITSTFFDIGTVIVSGLLLPLEGMGLILKTLTFGQVGDELIGLKDGVINGIKGMKEGSLEGITTWQTNMKDAITAAFEPPEIENPFGEVKTYFDTLKIDSAVTTHEMSQLIVGNVRTFKDNGVMYVGDFKKNSLDKLVEMKDQSKTKMIAVKDGVIGVLEEMGRDAKTQAQIFKTNFFDELGQGMSVDPDRFFGNGGGGGNGDPYQAELFGDQ